VTCLSHADPSANQNAQLQNTTGQNSTPPKTKNPPQPGKKTRWDVSWNKKMQESCTTLPTQQENIEYNAASPRPIKYTPENIRPKIKLWYSSKIQETFLQ